MQQSLATLRKEIPDEAWRPIWKLPDEISIPDWVEKNIKLSEKMAAEPGPLRIERTPYIRGPLEALGDVFIEEIVLVWGRQLGKSTGIQYSFACYVIAQDPGPATFLLPTRDKAKEISETKLDPIFRACPEVMDRMPDNPDDYTKLRMNFKTMVFAMAWAGSDTQTTTRSNRYLFVDEADEIKKEVGENAIDPIKGIEQTTTTFSNRKKVKTSTPTTPEGNIWQALKQCQYVFEYWIPCPHCGQKQILYWENVKFGENHDPIVVEEMAYYECEHCAKRISNLDKIRMLAKGEWRARTSPEPCDQILKNVRARIEETVSLDEVLEKRRAKAIGFHLPKWYSPFSGGTFGVIAKEFLEANTILKDGDDFAPMRNWRMYNAARPWERVAVSESQIELVKNEIDLPSLICPSGTIALTAGIDPGKGGFWYAVLAWKADHGPHLVQFGWLPGDYETSDIEELVRNRVYQVDGEERQLHPWRIGIDTGGGELEGIDLTMTAAAYEWIRRMRMRGLYGTKGLSRDIPKRLRQSRIDKMPGDKGIKIPGGLTLIEINTDAMKDLMWFRLNRNVIPCPKCKKNNRYPVHEFSSETPLSCHGCGAELEKKAITGLFTFYRGIEEEFLHHLLAEENRMEKDGKWKWVKIRQANHLLDCVCQAFAMADSEFDGGIRVIRQSPSGGQGEPGKMPPVNPVTQRPKGSWIKSW
jgi:phage terminase large subunit GpA-like protein